MKDISPVIRKKTITGAYHTLEMARMRIGIEVININTPPAIRLERTIHPPIKLSNAKTKTMMPMIMVAPPIK